MTLKMVKLTQLLICVTFCIALLVSTASCQPIRQESSSSPIVQTLANDQLNCPSFDQYVIKYQKGYVKGTKQYENRQRIYNQRVQQLKRKLNDPQITYKIGCNQFSDESQQQRTERKPLLVDQNQRKVASDKPHKLEQVSGKPSSLDWRQRNVITSIKDQGKCGACWTFATNAYGQSRMLLKNLTQDRDINLSEQYLLSCTPQCSCQGGYLEYVFQKAAGGVPLQNDYPYSPFFPSNPFICWTGQKQYFGYIPKKMYDLSGSQLEDLLQTSPVAISVSATNWEDYSGGVFRCKPFDKVNHAVLLVGYTPDYWIIKNQWATKWGENGFIRVDRSSLYNCKIGTSAFVMWESHAILALCLIAISFFAL